MKKVIKTMMVCLLTLAFTGCGSKKEEVTIAGWYEAVEGTRELVDFPIYYIQISDENMEKVEAYDGDGNYIVDLPSTKKEGGFEIPFLIDIGVCTFTSEGMFSPDNTLIYKKISIAPAIKPRENSNNNDSGDGLASDQPEGQWYNIENPNESIRIEDGKMSYSSETASIDDSFKVYNTEGQSNSFKFDIRSGDLGNGLGTLYMTNDKNLIVIQQDPMDHKLFAKKNITEQRVQLYSTLKKIMDHCATSTQSDGQELEFNMHPYGFYILLDDGGKLEDLFSGTWNVISDTEIELSYTDGETDVVNLEDPKKFHLDIYESDFEFEIEED